MFHNKLSFASEGCGSCSPPAVVRFSWQPLTKSCFPPAANSYQGAPFKEWLLSYWFLLHQCCHTHCCCWHSFASTTWASTLPVHNLIKLKGKTVLMTCSGPALVYPGGFLHWASSCWANSGSILKVEPWESSITVFHLVQLMVSI